MKRDGLLDVLVPVCPVVDADELLVFVRDVHRFEMLVERAVLVEQEVVLAAVDPQRGDAAVVDLLDDGEGVFRTAPWAFAEDPFELGLDVLDAIVLGLVLGERSPGRRSAS